MLVFFEGKPEHLFVPNGGFAWHVGHQRRGRRRFETCKMRTFVLCHANAAAAFFFFFFFVSSPPPFVRMCSLRHVHQLLFSVCTAVREDGACVSLEGAFAADLVLFTTDSIEVAKGSFVHSVC